MRYFQSAFSLWADSTSLKLTHIAELADIHGGDIYRIKTGKKDVTRSIITKLIPAIAAADSKQAAAKLLLAYYRDIAPPGFEDHLQISTAFAAPETSLDLLSAALQHHADRARQDSDYAMHIITLFLLARESDASKIEQLVDKWKKEKIQDTLYELQKDRAPDQRAYQESQESQIAMLAEPATEYKTGGGGNVHEP